MNRLVTGLAVAAAAATLSSTALAQAYLGAAGGRGTLPVECAGAFSCDKNGDAYRFLMGYRFAAGIATELGVSDFGTANVSGGGSSANVSVGAFTLGVAFEAPLGRWAGLTSRVGVARLKTEVNGFGFRQTDTNVAPYVGFGVYVAPWSNTRLEFGADQSRAELNGSKGDVRALLLGVRAFY